MNYLAHAFLSFQHPGILAGNMISDFVKGKKRYDYPQPIQLGISLHREIDRFTDTHPANREAKEIFRPAYRLYSASLVDVVFDHFLAVDEAEFSEESLAAFAKDTYKTLDQFTEHFPEPFGLMFPYMKNHNWLFNYRYTGGIEKSLGGVVRRSRYMTESETAFRLFNENYVLLQQCYSVFFPEVKLLAKKYFEQYNLPQPFDP
jgi:acyl carrier protein phosphodiesterase